MDTLLTSGATFSDSIFSPDSSEIWIRSLVMFMFLCFGALVERIFAKMDIAERAYQETLSLQTATLESTADGILVVDHEGHITIYNRRFQELWQIPDDVLEKRDDRRTIHYILKQLKNPEDFLNKVRELYSNPDAESYDVFEFVDGRVLERYSRPQQINGKSVGRVWSFRDVTSRHQAEKALRDSEERFRRLYESAPLGYQSLDENGCFLNINKTWLDLLGYAEADVIGKPFTDFLVPDDLRLFQTNFPRFKEHGEIHDVVFGMKRQDGAVVTVSLDGKIEKSQNGQFKRAHCIMHDVTQVKLAERALKQSEARFREMAELLPETIFECDRNGIFTFVNLHGYEVFGYSRNEVEKRMNIFHMLDPSELDRARQNSERIFQGNSSQNVEYVARKHDGTPFPITLHCSPIFRDGDIVGIRGIVIDVSEQRRVAAELRFHLEFERLITSLSAHFIGLPSDQVDAAVEDSLKKIGEFAGVDNCHVFYFSKDKAIVEYTSEWCKEGTPGLAENMLGKNPMNYSWGMEQLSNMKPIHLPNMSDPSEPDNPGRQFFGKFGIKSLISVPLSSGSSLVGAIGMATLLEEKTWDDDDIALLQVAGEVFSNALQRKNAEEALRDNENKYRILFESSPDGLFLMTDLFLDCNDQACRLWKCRRGDIVGYSPAKFSPEKQPDSRYSTESAAEKINAAMAGNPQTFYWQHKTLDGILQDTEVHLQALTINGRQLLLARVRDLSRQKKTEEALRNREAELKGIFKAAPIGIGTVIDRVFQSVNDRFCEMLGYTREELIGRSARMIYASDEDYDYVGREKYDQVKKCGIGHVETRWKRKDGTVLNILLSSSAIDGDDWSKGLVFSALDITERKRAEDALRLNEERYRHLYQNAEVGLFRSALEDGLVLECNDYAAAALGYADKEEFVNHYRLSQYYVDSDSRNILTADLRNKGRIDNVRIRLYKRDGSIMWVSVSANAYPEQGYAEGVMRDISDQRLVEETLRESEEKYRCIVENSSDLIMLTAPDGNIIYLSPQCRQILGYEPEEIIGTATWVVHPDDTPMVKEACKSGLEGKSGACLEYRIVTKDGQPRFISHSWSPVFKDDKLRMIVSVVRDITAGKVIQEALRQGEAKYRALIDTTGTGYVILDHDGKVLEANPEYVRLSGHHQLDDIKGRCVLEWTAADDKEKNRESIGKCLKEGKARNLEIRYTTPQGNIIPIEINATVVDTDGVTRILSLCRDITTRKQIEEAVLKSEEKYRATFENTGSASIVVEDNTIISLANMEFARLSGYSRQEIEGKKCWTEFVVKEDLERMLAQHRLRRETVGEALNHYDFRFVTRSGEIRNIFLTVDIIPGTKKSVASLIDITDLKKAEQELLNERGLFIAGPVVAMKWRNVENYPLEYVSPNIDKVLGYTAAEFLTGGKRFRDIIHPEDQSKTLLEAREYIDSGNPWYEQEYRVTHAQGGYRWVNDFTKVIRDSNGAITHFHCYILDVTKKKAAEEALAAETGRLTVTLQSIGDGVITCDVDGRIVLMNRIAEELTGWSAPDSVGHNLDEIFRIINRVSRQELINPVKNVLETGEPASLADGTLLISKDGAEKLVADSVAPIKDESGKMLGAVLVIRDITEREKIETELTRAEKLDSLGILAGGIAHDFNNILTAIVGNISIVLTHLKDDNQMYRLLLDAEKASLRAQELTQQLSDLLRRRCSDKKDRFDYRRDQ